MKHLLCVTGSRAEYGILRRLLMLLSRTEGVKLSIIATGMHCDPKYGSTYKNILNDGLDLSKVIDINLDSSNNEKIINSMSLCQNAFASIFANQDYDAVMILGDRYEIFSVATAAAMNNIPLIHLHGGEKTLGNYDEFIRHAISKMSSLHLVSTEEYRKRVIQLGEHPSSVINIGALGAENCLSLVLPDKQELESRFGSLVKPYFVVVFHPETLTKVSLTEQTLALITALTVFSEEYDFIFIGSNADTGSEKIIDIIKSFCLRSASRYMVSVSPEEYLGLLKYSCGLIGNSSSGIIEAPSLNIATINIGDRQKGRVHGDSVIDAACTKAAIIAAIELSQSVNFHQKITRINNPYYKKDSLKNAGDAIVRFLYSEKDADYKDFYDVDFNI
ncbi:MULTISPECIES: UDP-N-acetylglucosamine 2-epimerase [Edwardsiella]|uniref:UDP-N-acetylglucosamine 2-epimerase n=2 Tax=Edwardsiella anguillarum TaxID=1821960 RepID=A0A076LNY5_9GAMM|nr:MULTISPECIES: UDP-N-acetylglucosamine 2-epimerase [Edwardsiella]AIJ09581.1 UDP-N-acetylglucosamine 2-epimerase [Edwardsiella anguillarum ET080813]AKR77343.2 UDP-N-acetylglucosamine 2-epimerase [Edwardsiella sp. LADL05-105]KAB0592558.1 UDP-N-acetylglucosamine 2-epimerase (hydrolyzing) [Edwardsiella anguillarum]UOU80371.1 UDP-N-acetylglucosamine 2-epimerase [Edwardsiella anguillarum]WHP81426.1 UDP-N-acetylglucosamine 2-epimerase [Edwardsiella anguillarum]